MDLQDIKIKELDTYIELLAVGSVRQLARLNNCPAGQISKLIQSLEHKLDVQLLERSATGVQATAKGSALLPHLQKLRTLVSDIEGVMGQSKQKEYLSFATTSFFSTHFLPQIFSKIHHRKPNLNIRLIDLPPDRFIPVAMRSGFQFCVHLKDLEWPKTWTSDTIGEIKWEIVARKEHPVVAKPTLANILKYPFVYPVYWSQDGIRYGNDSCPIPINKRVRGFETATATSALEVVKNSDQLGFLPNLLSKHDVLKGNLERIPVRSWKKVSQPVYLTVKNDNISQKDYEWLKSICRNHLLGASD